MALVVQQRQKATVKKGGPGGFLPLVQCDYCEEVVDRGANGVVGWKRSETETYRRVLFLHDDCAEDYQDGRNVRLKTMALGNYVRFLGHNLKVEREG